MSIRNQVGISRLPFAVAPTSFPSFVLSGLTIVRVLFDKRLSGANIDPLRAEGLTKLIIMKTAEINMKGGGENLSDLEIKDAHLIFESVWQDLQTEYGRENLRFPKEII